MRKRAPEEHVDSEKWAIPYADLLTLLLAFFVVMYSLSSLNEGKYRILAESLSAAFTGTGKVIDSPVPPQPNQDIRTQHAQTQTASTASPISLIPVQVTPRDLPPPGHEGTAAEASPGHDPQAGPASVTQAEDTHAPSAAETASLTTISDEIAKALQPWVDSRQVIIRRTQFWLEVEIRTDVLFPSGVADLASTARGVLGGVATVLAKFPNPIRIEGFTDDRPIDTTRYPSNWELSAARAGSVARLFTGLDIQPRRIGIYGWSAYHPVASNDTPEGRNRNRRIAIVVLAQPDNPPGIDAHASSRVADATMASPDPSNTIGAADAGPVRVTHGTHAESARPRIADGATGSRDATTIDPTVTPRPQSSNPRMALGGGDPTPHSPR